MTPYNFKDDFTKYYIKAERWAYDIEIYRNFFSVIFLNVKTGIKITFVIHESRNDRYKLISWLNSKPRLLIGYNNLGFDGAVLTFLMMHQECSLLELWEFAQRIIQKRINPFTDWLIANHTLHKHNNRFTEHYSNINKKNPYKKTISGKEFKEKVRFYKDREDNTEVDNYMLNWIKEEIQRGNINIYDFVATAHAVLEDLRVADFEYFSPYRYPKEGINYKQLDLMLVEAFHKVGISLKQIGVNLKHHRLQDLPIKWDQEIVKEVIPMMLDYNTNDVVITYKLFKDENIQEALELRELLSLQYETNLMNASRSKIANVLLEKIYISKVDIDLQELRLLRTNRDSVKLKDVISDKVVFKTPRLKALLEKLKSLETRLYTGETSYDVHSEDGYKFKIKLAPKFKFKTKFMFDGTIYTMGVGGLHSDDKKSKQKFFETTNKHLIIDADVASYYPNIMINLGIFPKHLVMEFLEILKQITEQRLEAKKQAKADSSNKFAKMTADSLKITINSIFGKLGFDMFWLYDPASMLGVTINGQLFLLMLIEELSLLGIPTVSANTDGIVSKIPVRLKDEYDRICKKWQQYTNFDLEYNIYEKYYRLDVNNYLTIKQGDKPIDKRVKLKGRLETGIALNKGYQYPIVRQAVYNKLVHNIGYRDTINNGKDILDFCISQKASNKFQFELHKDNNEIEILQKTNRFFIGNPEQGYRLLKRDMETEEYLPLLDEGVNNKKTALYKDYPIVLLNDYDKNTTIDNYDIQYDFYVEKAKEIIDIVMPPVVQLSLF